MRLSIKKHISYSVFLIALILSSTATVAAENAPPTAAERQRAYLSLFNQNKAKNFPILMQALKDPDPYVRYTGAWMLNPDHMDNIGKVWFVDGSMREWIEPLTPVISKNIVAGLLNALPEEDHWARREMLSAVVNLQKYQVDYEINLNPFAKKVFLSQMTSHDLYTRLASIKGLANGRIGSEVAEVFRKAISDPAWAIRREALRYFKSDFNIVSELLQDSHASVRQKAVRLLYSEHQHNPKTIDLLITQLGDTDHWVLEYTIRQLGYLGNSKAIVPLLVVRNSNGQTYPEQPGAIFALTGEKVEDALVSYQDKIKDTKIPRAPINKSDQRPLSVRLDKGNDFENVTILQNIRPDGYNFAYEDLIHLLDQIETYSPLVKYHIIWPHISPLISSWADPGEIHQKSFDVFTKLTEHQNPHIRRVVKEKIGHFAQYDVYNKETIDQISQQSLIESDPFLLRANILNIGISMVQKERSKLGGVYIPAIPMKGVEELYLELSKSEFQMVNKIAISRIEISCSPELLDEILTFQHAPFSGVRVIVAQKLQFRQYPFEVNWDSIQSILKDLAQKDPSTKVRRAANRSYIENKASTEQINHAPRKSQPWGCQK